MRRRSSCCFRWAACSSFGARRSPARRIAGLGGGGIGQNFGVGGKLVRTRGGWGQLLLKPTPAVELGMSYGMDDPKDEDLVPPPVASRTRRSSGTSTGARRPSFLVSSSVTSRRPMDPAPARSRRTTSIWRSARSSSRSAERRQGGSPAPGQASRRCVSASVQHEVPSAPRLPRWPRRDRTARRGRFAERRWSPTMGAVTRAMPAKVCATPIVIPNSSLDEAGTSARSCSERAVPCRSEPGG